MRALVSGATGFSGRHLVERLRADGIEVHAVSHRTAASGIERLDLTSSTAWTSVIETTRPDYVFHLSGIAQAPTFSDYVTVNTLAAAALLDAALAAAHRPRAVLLVGTAAEYGVVPPDRLPVREDFPASPRTSYGATKFAQTQLGLESASRGLRVVVARPTNIIGAGMPASTSLGSFAQQLRRIELGRAPPVLNVGNLATSRDLVDARDVADIYVLLAKRDDFSGIVNIASGREVEIRSVLDDLIREFGLDVAVEIDPARFRAVDVPRFSADTTRLTALFGTRSWIPLAESLRELVRHERSVTS